MLGGNGRKRWLVLLIFSQYAASQMIGEAEKPAPLETEPTYKGVVACDMTDACNTKDYMCICQKLMWAIDYNRASVLKGSKAVNDRTCIESN